MKIGLATGLFVNNDIEANTKTIKQYLQQAKEKQVDLLLFGESFLQGFDSLTWNPKDDEQVALAKDSEPIQRLQSYCRELQIGLGFGYMELVDNQFYCSYLVFNENGDQLFNYRRISDGWRIPTADSQFYKEGNQLEVFDYQGQRIIVGLCGDFWNNEIAQKIPSDVDLVLWPNFITCKQDFWEREEFAEYVKHAKSLAPNVLFLNSICYDDGSIASGGAFAVIDGELNYQQNMGINDVLVVTVKK